MIIINKNEKVLISISIILFVIILGILIIPFLELNYFKVLSTGFEHDNNYYSENNLEIYLLPSTTATDKVLKVINSANTEIHCALRSLNDTNLEDLLLKKEKTIKVRLFINSDYLGNKRMYQPFVKFSDQNMVGMMHNNYCIIDGKTVITGSIIFNQNTLGKNLHDVLIINSIELASEYNSDFWKLYNREEIIPSSTPKEFIKINENTEMKVLFCPRDDCEKEMVNQINNAKKEVLFATYSFTNFKVINALKENKNITFSGVIDQSGLTKDSIFFENLKNVKLSRLTEIIHTKLITVDDNISITGTTNPTYFGTQLNNENLLIIKSKEINFFYKSLLKYLIKISE